VRVVTVMQRPGAGGSLGETFGTWRHYQLFGTGAAVSWVLLYSRFIGSDRVCGFARQVWKCDSGHKWRNCRRKLGTVFVRVMLGARD
jgi:hypothetical protein